MIKFKVGDSVGRLIILEISSTDKYGQRRALTKCKCGIIKSIRVTHLGCNIFSCGCLRRELGRQRGATLIGKENGWYKHGKTETPEWIIWSSMRGRCYNKNNQDYSRYGGRGIKVCSRWRTSFLNFFADMGPRPKSKTLDRRDNEGNYESSNCRWATAKQQANNRRPWGSSK